MIQEAPLLDLLDCVVDNRGKSCPLADAGFPLLTTNAVDGARLHPNLSEARTVSRTTYETWFRALPEAGDILLVTKGTPGKVCLVPEGIPPAIAQDMVALRPSREKVDPWYLFAVLRSKRTRDAIGRLHVGALIPHFRKADFSRLRVPLLARAEQRFVGNFHRTLSERIELAYSKSETLRMISRRAFSDLGVRLVREKDELRTDERVVPASSLFELRRGVSYRSAGFADEGLPLLTLGVFAKDGTFLVEQARSYSGPHAENQRAAPGDLLVVNTDITRKSGLLGMPFIVPENAAPESVVSHHAYIARPHAKGMLGAGALYEFFASPETRERSRRFSVGTTVRFLPSEALFESSIVVPKDRKKLAEFEEIFGLVERRRAALREEIRASAALRDEFVERVVGGKVSLEAAKRALVVSRAD